MFFFFFFLTKYYKNEVSFSSSVQVCNCHFLFLYHKLNHKHMHRERALWHIAVVHRNLKGSYHIFIILFYFSLICLFFLHQEQFSFCFSQNDSVVPLRLVSCIKWSEFMLKNYLTKGSENIKYYIFLIHFSESKT